MKTLSILIAITLTACMAGETRTTGPPDYAELDGGIESGGGADEPLPTIDDDAGYEPKPPCISETPCECAEPGDICIHNPLVPWKCCNAPRVPWLTCQPDVIPSTPECD